MLNPHCLILGPGSGLSTQGWKHCSSCPTLIHIHRALIHGLGLWQRQACLNSNQHGKKIRNPGIKFNHYDMIWYPNNSPKMSIYLWRAIKGKLPTKAFLKDLNIIPSDQCLLCSKAPETVQHLFFECCYSSYIWHCASWSLALKM